MILQKAKLLTPVLKSTTQKNKYSYNNIFGRPLDSLALNTLVNWNIVFLIIKIYFIIIHSYIHSKISKYYLLF